MPPGEPLIAGGLTAPHADNSMPYKIEGPGEIIATDNGDELAPGATLITTAL